MSINLHKIGNDQSMSPAIPQTEESIIYEDSGSPLSDARSNNRVGRISLPKVNSKNFNKADMHPASQNRKDSLSVNQRGGSEVYQNLEMVTPNGLPIVKKQSHSISPSQIDNK